MRFSVLLSLSDAVVDTEWDAWRLRLIASVYGRPLPGLTSWPDHSDAGSLSALSFRAAALLDIARRGLKHASRQHAWAELGGIWNKVLMFEWETIFDSFFPIFGLLSELERLIGVPGGASCTFSMLEEASYYPGQLIAYLNDDRRYCDPDVDAAERSQRKSYLFHHAVRAALQHDEGKLVLPVQADMHTRCTLIDLASRYIVLARLSDWHAPHFSKDISAFKQYAGSARVLLQRAGALGAAGLPGFSILRLLRLYESDHLMSSNFLQAVLPETPTVVEAGVSGGEDTLSLCKDFPGSTIYGFEPHPYSFAQASEALKFCPCNVSLLNIALANASTEMPLYLQVTHEGAIVPSVSSILRLSTQRAQTFSTEYRAFSQSLVVNTTTIDNWAVAAGVRRIDLIWFDLEGAESLVINATDPKGVLASARLIRVEYNRPNDHEGAPSHLRAIESALNLRGFHLLVQHKYDRLGGDALFIHRRCLDGSIAMGCEKQR